jgi:beta-phosphoglucomutase
VLRAILFDFNGVLVDDEPIHLELFQRILAEEGIELAADEYYEDLVGFDDEGCFTAVYEAFDREMTPDLLQRLIDRKSAAYQEWARTDGFPFFSGAEDFIRAAIASPLRLGVVSGALRGEVEGALAQLGVREDFLALVAAEDVSEGKPNPEGYRRGLELLNSASPPPSRRLHPHEVLVIEDTPAGLRSASANGLATLGVAQTLAAAELTLADHVIGSLAEVTLPQIQEFFAR